MGGCGMSLQDDTERWVQCSRCSKWRCVPEDDVMRIADGPWRCSFNVFSSQYNTCAAPQETMPAAAPAPAAPPLSALAEEVCGAMDVVAEASADDLFTVSECTCSLCSEINAAVRAWPQTCSEPHVVPILDCVVRSIAATAEVAKKMEEEKRFLFKPDEPAVPSA